MRDANQTITIRTYYPTAEHYFKGEQTQGLRAVRRTCRNVRLAPVRDILSGHVETRMTATVTFAGEERVVSRPALDTVGEWRFEWQLRP